MKTKISPLHILDFAITELDFSLVAPSTITENVNSYFKKYSVDIDFGIKSGELLNVYIKAEINRSEEKLPGYSLMAEAACFFQFDTQIELPDDVRHNLEGFSTIYIALNSLRGLISNFTANAPFGRYILPSIDLNDLIEKKKALINSKKADEKKTNSGTRKGSTKRNKNSI